MNSDDKAVQPVLQKAMLQINNSYLDWDKVQNMQFAGVPFTNKEIWLAALDARQQGFTRNLSVENYHFKWSLSNAMEALLHELDIAIAGGAAIKELLTEKDKPRHSVNALVDEAYTSAQLAGFAITKKTARELLLKSKVPQNTQEQVVSNLYKALQKLNTLKNEQLTKDNLLALHVIVTKDTIKLKGIGNLRANNKFDLSGIEASPNYKAPDYKELQKLTAFIVNFFNDDKTPFFIHPLIKAAIIEWLVLYVRPFKDANGRMARLLSKWYLLKTGYWVMDYIPASNVIVKLKLQYQKCFSQIVTNENDIGYLIHFETQALRMAYRSFKELLQRSVKEKTENKFLKADGLNTRQVAALQWIKDDAEKIITIRELRSGFGVSKETARTDLTALVEQGWLKNYNLNKKTYAFVKGNKFDSLLK